MYELLYSLFAVVFSMSPFDRRWSYSSCRRPPHYPWNHHSKDNNTKRHNLYYWKVYCIYLKIYCNCRIYIYIYIFKLFSTMKIEHSLFIVAKLIIWMKLNQVVISCISYLRKRYLWIPADNSASYSKAKN